MNSSAASRQRGKIRRRRRRIKDDTLLQKVLIVSLDLFLGYILALKFKYSEKACHNNLKKKISHLFWACIGRFFFNFLWTSQNIWTLHFHHLIAMMWKLATQFRKCYLSFSCFNLQFPIFKFLVVYRIKIR